MNEYILTFETDNGGISAKKVLARSLPEAVKTCPEALLSVVLIAKARTKKVA